MPFAERSLHGPTFVELDFLLEYLLFAKGTVHRNRGDLNNRPPGLKAGRFDIDEYQTFLRQQASRTVAVAWGEW